MPALYEWKGVIFITDIPRHWLEVASSSLSPPGRRPSTPSP